MRYGTEKRNVVFNLNKEEERRMFQFSSSMNFSGWVKQQLAKEMKRQQKPITSVESTFQFRADGDR